jgi:hypothetical protein
MEMGNSWEKEGTTDAQNDVGEEPGVEGGKNVSISSILIAVEGYLGDLNKPVSLNAI